MLNEIMQTENPFNVKNKPSYVIPFVLITSLFFLWGFAISMLDVLNKHFQEVLNITKAKSGFIQLAVYGAYFLVALPAGYFIKKYGYKRGIILGLFLYSIGCFMFYPATRIQTFEFFVFALFIIGSGLAILETVANPYVTVLGSPEGAVQRLNLAQSFNGLGVILGPLVGGLLIFTKNDDVNQLSSIQLPYLTIGFVVLLLSFIFMFIKLPEIEEDIVDADNKHIKTIPLLKQKHFTYGVITQFLYVGVQAGIWGFFINYATEVQEMSNQEASFYLSGAMVLYTIGRFSSTLIMRFVQPQKLLLLYAVLSLSLVALVIMNLGMISVYALIFICFCMSIMFPTIFGLGVRNLGTETKRGGSIMIMSIVGGAVVPPLMGLLADEFSMTTAFYLPALCFIAIILYAARGYKLNGKASNQKAITVVK